MIYLLICLASYLVGSFPSAYLLGERRQHKDIRQMGSGNVGTTNAFRTLGKKEGILTFLLDFFKGFLPIFLIHHFSQSSLLLALNLLFVILGHCFSLFLHFQGGKGVATAAGEILAVNPLLFLLVLLAFLIVYLASRLVSLASLAAALLLGILAWFFPLTLPVKVSLSLMALLVIVRHRSNIRRLKEGEEKPFYFFRGGRD